MDRGNLIDRLEHGLERSLEVPFERVSPFDAMAIKRRFRRAAEGLAPGPTPDSWYLLLPPSLQPYERDVRELVFALWRSLVTEREGEPAVAARRPSVRISYDAELPADEVMVGFDPPLPPPPARPVALSPVAAPSFPPPAPAAQPVRGRRAVISSVLSWAFAAILVAAITSLLVRSETMPALAPSFSPPTVPGIALSPVHHVARIDLNVRSEPSPNAPVVGVIPAGQRLAVFPYNVVEGEAVAGESRWVEVSPLPGYVLGERRYVWYGGLEPQQ